MSLDAPQAHTTHELMTLVATLLDRSGDTKPADFPRVLLATATGDGPFDFGAVYQVRSGKLTFVDARGFPWELKDQLDAGFGVLDILTAALESGEPTILSSIDGDEALLEQRLGASSALITPLGGPADGFVVLLASILHDVTEVGEGFATAVRALARQAHARDERSARAEDIGRRWDRLIQVVSDALLFADPKGTVVDANPAAAELFASRREDLVGARLNSLLPGLSYRSEEWSGTAKLGDGTSAKVKVATSVLPRGEDGSELYLHAVSRRLALLSVMDEDSVPVPSSSEPLPDRKSFLEDLNKELHLATKYRGWCSVLVMDLDNMSAVRQELGTGALEVVRDVGEQLKERLRRSDRLARLHGDGFGLLLSRGTREQAQALATKLLELVREGQATRGFKLTASIGISWFPDDGETAEEMLETAFGAMMVAKRRGGDQALVWSPAMAKGGRKTGDVPAVDVSGGLRITGKHGRVSLDTSRNSLEVSRNSLEVSRDSLSGRDGFRREPPRRVPRPATAPPPRPAAAPPPRPATAPPPKPPPAPAASDDLLIPLPEDSDGDIELPGDDEALIDEVMVGDELILPLGEDPSGEFE